MSIILIRRNQIGRTPTRGKSNARPLSSGMEIFDFIRHAGRWLPSLRALGAVIFSRVTEPGGWQTTTGHRVPLKFVRAIQAARSLISRLHRAPALFQSSARAVAYVFQVTRSFQTAPASHVQSGMGRFPNERKSTARDGNLTARERNYAC